MKSSVLLTVDAAINLVLGILLLVFPADVVGFLGIPEATPAFYPNILGGVLVGIGIALLFELFHGSSGLGLAGAVSINLCGGLTLAGWLAFGSLDLPLRGAFILWALVSVLLGISTIELVAQKRITNE